MGCSYQQVLRRNLGWFLSYHWKTLFLRGLILQPRERAQVRLKSGTRDFQNSPPFERSACFYVTISGIFFLKNFFKKNWSTVFQLKALRLKTHHFHTKLPYQKPMLRQIKQSLQSGPLKKNRVFPLTTLFFWKFCFSLRTKS